MNNESKQSLSKNQNQIKEEMYRKGSINRLENKEKYKSYNTTAKNTKTQLLQD